jgi:hypothetical protein
MRREDLFHSYTFPPIRRGGRFAQVRNRGTRVSIESGRFLSLRLVENILSAV